MAFTLIDDSSAEFQIATWTGNTSAPRTITNDGNSDLQPDIVWAKNRTTNGTDHELYNSTIGTGTSGNLQPNNANGVGTGTTYGQLTAFTTDGFTVNAGGTNDDKFNENGSKFVAWQWKVGGGSTSTNNDGNMATTVQANTTAGVSLVFYDGDGTQTGKTAGHGLGAVPKMIISKDRDATSNVPGWRIYHQAIGATKYLDFTTPAAGVFNDWDNTNPTTSVYSIGGAGGYTPTNTNNTEYIALVFADVQGFSKMGRYTGNGDSNGAFVWCGFKPAFVMTKNTTNAGYDWTINDSKRDPVNEVDQFIWANNSSTEYDGAGISLDMDFLSNGFTIKTSRAELNNNSAVYIFMAFAENPFVTSTGIPTTAR